MGQNVECIRRDNVLECRMQRRMYKKGEWVRMQRRMYKKGECVKMQNVEKGEWVRMKKVENNV